MNLTRKKIIDFIGLGGLILLLVWLPFSMKQPDIAHRKILVATEKLQDGIFDKTVILVLKHNGFGAFGLTLNQPTQHKGGLDWGGPVGKDIYTLHSLDITGEKTIRVPELDLGYTRGEDFLDEIDASPKKPREYVTFRGYAGWGRGQLNREITRGAWKVIDFDRDFVFHSNPKKVWATANARPEIKQK